MFEHFKHENIIPFRENKEEPEPYPSPEGIEVEGLPIEEEIGMGGGVGEVKKDSEIERGE